MKKIVYIAVLVVGIIIGCTKNDEVINQSVMSFGFSVTEDTTATRGTILNSSGFETTYATAGFGVWGFQGNSLVLGGASSGSKVTFDNTTNIWKSESPFPWVVGNAMSFFAYAPYTIGTAEAITAVSSNGGSPTVSYTVSSDIASQVDLLVAKNINLARPSNGIIPLNFTHPLAAIVFKTGSKFEAGSEIISISLKNVATSGVYNISTGSWASTSGSGSYTLTKNRVYQPSTAISSSSEVMFMIPQTFSDETATLEVVYISVADPNKRHTISISLKNTSFTAWEAGKKYTYIISPEVEEIYEFDIEDISTLDYTAKTKTFTVRSSKTRGGTTSNVGWTIEYSATGATGSWSSTKPSDSWITVTPPSDVTSSANGTLSTTWATDITSYNWGSPKGSFDSPYNLSSNGYNSNVERTSNCYIVNAPGWYKIPLVYGNAIDKNKNPTYPYINAKAFGGDNDACMTFQNSEGHKITQPFIISASGANSMQQAVGTMFYWTDVEGILGQVGSLTVEDPYFFVFQIVTVSSGNLFFTLCDNTQDRNIIWSWHIWVTDTGGSGDFDRWSPVDKGGDGNTMRFMAYNLGYKDYGSTVYQSREYWLKFTQTGSGESKVVKVASAEKRFEPTRAYSTVYQWGRKDPFPGSYNNEEQPVYPSNVFNRISVRDNDNNLYYTPISQAHKYPTYFFYDPEKKNDERVWCSDQYFNNWNANLQWDALSTNDNVPVYKTIYDPCPVGYCVPNRYAFAGFSATELPNVSFRHGSSGLIGASWRFYWSSNPSNFKGGYYFSQDGTVISDYRAHGGSIRPIRE